LFGVTVDPDKDGSEYGIDIPPRCPVCSSNRIADWVATAPPEFVEVNPTALTHLRWSCLSKENKLRELELAASDFLSS
jgi:hypothetical protein